MAWGGISLTAPTHLLVRTNENFNNERYILDILEEHVQIFY